MGVCFCCSADVSGSVEDGVWAFFFFWSEDLAWSISGFGLKFGRC